MYIKTVKKKNKYSPKIFEYQYLVESIRTKDGPRQRFLLNLGVLDLPQEEWPLLAKRIEEILRGQETLFGGNPKIDRLASDYAQKIIRKYEYEYSDDQRSFENVDIDSISHTKNRSIGCEHVCLSFLKKLKLDWFLKNNHFSQREIEIAILLILARLIKPGSERNAFIWAQKISGLDELLDTDFSQLSLNSLYKTMDRLQQIKPEIETHLTQTERRLFELEEKIILYDLTNTYLGQAKANSKAKFGRSKDKRNDCRLLTLGLVVDEMGFPKASKVFSGNQSEPNTLATMLKEITEINPNRNKNQRPTVVIDAGIATEDNLEKLGEDYYYVCVSRRKPEIILKEDLVVIKKTKENEVTAQKITQDGETFLYCKSNLKAAKENAIQGRLEQLFQDRLLEIKAALFKKGGTKKYTKVLERVGRLREKYKRINRFYDIKVTEKDGIAVNIEWKYVKEQSDQHFSGAYYLRTNRTDLDEKQIWQLYTMLTELEDGFRTLKSELNLCPLYHKKKDRNDAHIFITILAYHILRAIQVRLQYLGYRYRWKTIRNLLNTRQRSTIKITTKEGKTIYLRKCSDPESVHRVIYDALQLDYIPCKAKKTTIENL